MLIAIARLVQSELGTTNDELMMGTSRRVFSFISSLLLSSFPLALFFRILSYYAILLYTWCFASLWLEVQWPDSPSVDAESIPLSWLRLIILLTDFM